MRAGFCVFFEAAAAIISIFTFVRAYYRYYALSNIAVEITQFHKVAAINLNMLKVPRTGKVTDVFRLFGLCFFGRTDDSSAPE
jgi:hypothetical protein